MKIALTIILTIFTIFLIFHNVPVFKYKGEFDKYIDSSGFYSEKYSCYLRLGNDSSAYALKMEKQFVDSASKYYYLMYPLDAGKAEVEKELDCNCK